MRPVLLVASVLVFIGCHDFDAEYSACVARGRCTAAGAGGSAAGGMAGGEAVGGGSVSGGGVAGGAGGGLSSNEAPSLCFGGVCWESPVPFGYDLTGVAAASDDEAWFVGAGGAVAHWKNGSLSAWKAPTDSLVSVATNGTRALAASPSKLIDVTSPDGSVGDDVADELTLVHHDGTAFVAVTTNSATGTSAIAPVAGLNPTTFQAAAVGKTITGVAGPRGDVRVVLTSDGGASVVEQLTADMFLGPWAPVGLPAGFQVRAAARAMEGWWYAGADGLFTPGQLLISDAGTDFASMASSGSTTAVLDRAGGVVRCVATNCRRVDVEPARPVAVAVADGSVFLAGLQGAMTKILSDGGVRRLAGGSGDVTSLQIGPAGDGLASLNLPRAEVSDILHRTDGGWEPIATVRGEAFASVLSDAGLIVGTRAGISEAAIGGLREATMNDTDGGRVQNLTIFKLAHDQNGGWLAAGIFGAVFRRAAGSQAWNEVSPPRGGRSCAWTPGGSCQFEDFVALSDGRWLGCGLHDNGGFTLLREADGGVLFEPRTDRKETILRLPDGGVFIGGHSSTALLGAPANLQPYPIVPSTDGVWSAGYYRGHVIGVWRERVFSLRDNGSELVLTELFTVPGADFRALTVVGSDAFVGGQGAAIVRFSLSDAGL